MEDMNQKYKIGYTTGVYDLFHIGHLNIIKKAKECCDYLIVGVTTDELVSYKNKRAVIPFEERFQIIEAIKYVDKAIPQMSLDKRAAWEKYRFNAIFVGDDWKGTDTWQAYEKSLKEVGVDVIYFPYTKGTSSTIINKTLTLLQGQINN